VKVRWTASARLDRLDIADHIAADSPRAAVRMDIQFSEAVETLARFPQMGRVGKVPRTREIFPHENYRLVYEVEDDTVWVLTLIHTSRQWPPERG
jgi:plasmid stabilization system protein ParE